MSRIMILGAGVYQVPLIRKAREMGIETIVVSTPGPYRGFELADRCYYTDTRDRESILSIAREEKIDGICTTGTDVAVSSIGYVCSRTGLKGIGEEAAERLCNKALMKEAFLKHGVSCAEGERVRSAGQACLAAERIGFPAVIKRVDSSGSRGITIVRRREEVPEAYACALEKSRYDYALAERCLTGTEIGIDGYIRGGRVVFCAPHGKFLYHGTHTTVPVGHSFPLNCSRELEDEIYRQMQLAADATGADDCCFNADVFVDGNRVWIIEMGGRCGATCIPELIHESTGFDYYRAMIMEAMGESAYFPENVTYRPCMAKLLISPVEGTVTEIDHDGIDRIRRDGVQVTIDPEVGGHVFSMSDGTDRIGSVLMHTGSEEELDRKILEVGNCIFINGRRLSDL